MRTAKKRVHFVGIGGIGMSGIAEVLLSQGYVVSGSDLHDTEITRALKEHGAKISVGHSEENLGAVDVVVISSAVRDTNPEVVAARKRNIPIIPRAEMLGELMRLKTGVAIAGTHGKTTTTSMVATVVNSAGLDPTIIIGGRVDALGGNARLGKSDLLIAEADESDKSFLCLPATIGVITNIDNDHLDHYGDFERVKDAFVDFINKIPFYGRAILCVDDSNVRSILPRVKKPFVTYGFSPQAQYQARNVRRKGFASEFDVVRDGNILGTITCNLPGEHMVLNALAAVAVAEELEIPFAKIAEGFTKFNGVKRRFEFKGEKAGITFIDDYAHHPTEIRATLKGIRANWPGRIVTVFQPHRYSRTRDCYSQFVAAFDDTDILYVTDIYPAGEEPIQGVTAEILSTDIQTHGHRSVSYVGALDRAIETVGENLKKGDLFITLGAGSVYKVGEGILRDLK